MKLLRNYVQLIIFFENKMIEMCFFFFFLNNKKQKVVYPQETGR